MSSIREEFDIRHLMKGVVFEGELHQVGNLQGVHEVHIHDLVDLHIDGEVMQCRILGKANEHIVGEIVAIDFPHDFLKAGRKIVFDMDNVFVCHEDH